jgi:hypothetical protein
VTCYRMSECGAEPIKSVGRARGRRTVHVCGPTTIPARGPRELVLGFSESGCDVEPIMSVGRARRSRTVRICGPATIPAGGPREPVLGFSESNSKENVKLFLSTPLRQVRKNIYSCTHS